MAIRGNTWQYVAETIYTKEDNDHCCSHKGGRRSCQVGGEVCGNEIDAHDDDDDDSADSAARRAMSAAGVASWTRTGFSGVRCHIFSHI